MNIWKDTYRNITLKGLPGVELLTAVNSTTDDDDQSRYLVARLSIEARSDAVHVIARADMTPAQMRELAVSLIAQARRIEDELIPLLHPAPEIIPFRLHHEPEEAAA